MAKAKVVHSHTPDTSDFIAGTEGDILSYVFGETEYPGWIWCTDSHGSQAWVPQAYVSIEGQSCRSIRDYYSRELGVNEGEDVQILARESGWAWVQSEQGSKGWVPPENLALSRWQAVTKLGQYETDSSKDIGNTDSRDIGNTYSGEEVEPMAGIQPTTLHDSPGGLGVIAVCSGWSRGRVARGPGRSPSALLRTLCETQGATCCRHV